MNLNDLKPAWRQFLFFNSIESVDETEILSIIERADRKIINGVPRILVNTIMFIFISIFCQGG